MMDSLHTLAHFVRLAAEPMGYRTLATRCGIVSRQHEYVYRAAHPLKEMPSGKLSPVMNANLVRLIDGIGLTFAKHPDAPVQVWHICQMIEQLPIRPDAKSMAIHVVHRAGMMLEEGT